MIMLPIPFFYVKEKRGESRKTKCASVRDESTGADLRRCGQIGTKRNFHEDTRERENAIFCLLFTIA